MARHRTPTATLEVRGSFIQHPARIRPNEPTSDEPLGGPPKRLAAEEKKVWREIKARVLPGVACRSDRDAFEVLVRLTHKVRTNFEFMKVAELTLLTSLWARFGMTPADRSRVSVTKPPKSDLSKFLQKREESRKTESPALPN